MPRRSDYDILLDMNDVYGSLSPENLKHDGERPEEEWKREEAELNARLAALFEELGYELDEWQVGEELKRRDREQAAHDAIARGIFDAGAT